jgi:hypothetical protein
MKNICPQPDVKLGTSFIFDMDFKELDELDYGRFIYFAIEVKA